ncbi:MAG: leucine-rich repeat domain-containing protein [Flavobacteriia bacterium]|nr:leucine-rich repeat domain-containing protein [Flavobacteriia bacterium]
MKKIAGLCFILFQLSSFAQNKTVNFINWDNAKLINPNEIEFLDCSKLKWKEIPTELRSYKNLKILLLNKNQLTDLPSFLSEFEDLEEIDLGKNKFSSLPFILLKMKHLKKIYLYKNQITILNEEVCELSSLIHLDLWENPISILPDCMSELKSLKEVHLEGIAFSERFQQDWILKMPNTQFFFDKPCSCKD